jgi:hypothetical protein
MAEVTPGNADYTALIDAITKDKPLTVDGWTPLFPQNDVRGIGVRVVEWTPKVRQR